MIYPFKWAGNKKDLLPIIQDAYITSKCDRIIEPFCGSAVFSLNTKAVHYEISDKNEAVIGLFLYLKNDWDKFNEILAAIDLDLIKTNQVEYNKLRQRYNDCEKSILKSVLLFVLLGACTNNLARFNQSNEFNQTWGKRKAQPLKYLTNELRDKLNNINFNIYARSYDKIVGIENTFVYCDPPYLLSNDCYHAKEWDIKEERKFLDWLKTLECKWALSNIINKNGEINEALKTFANKYNLIQINKNYNAKVGGYSKDTKNITQEILVTNFDFKVEKEVELF